MGGRLSRVSELYPCKWLSPADLQRPVTVTILSVDVEELRQADGSRANKLVLTFRNAHKRMVLNQTQAKWLAELLGLEEIPVNSLHGQGIKTLGKGLEALAHAEDGVIEAIHLPQAPQFTLGVQWHPEWQASQNPQSVRLFEAFGAACRKRVAEQNG